MCNVEAATGTVRLVVQQGKSWNSKKAAKKAEKNGAPPPPASTSSEDQESIKSADQLKMAIMAKLQIADKSVFTHIVEDLSQPDVVTFVFNAVVAMILEANLKASGLA